jgi:P-type Cu+ transporter
MAEHKEEMQFLVTGMTCATCSKRVEKALREVPGVVAANVNLASEEASVVCVPTDANWDTLKAAIERAGYGVIEPTASDTADAPDAEEAARAAEVAAR